LSLAATTSHAAGAQIGGVGRVAAWQHLEMAILPDDKNWTWVLDRICPDCGFDASQVDPLQMADPTRSVAAEIASLLDHPHVADRPDEQTWSALEYGCHVRDVFRIFDARLASMLADDGVQFSNWDQDAKAVEDRYGEQSAATVAAELLAAGEAFAARFATVTTDQLARRGLRSDSAAFTVDSFARYFLHDPVHHVADIRKGYAAIAAAR
jgi:hypothetical protein